MRNLLRSRQRGQTLVEFALIIPIFLLLTVGFLDLGRAVYYYSAIHNAAREGARYGVVLETDSDGNFTAGQRIEIKTRARDKAVAVGVTLADVDAYDPASFPATPGRNVDIIRVCVNFEFSPITPFIAQILGAGNTLPMSSCSRMLMER